MSALSLSRYLPAFLLLVPRQVAARQMPEEALADTAAAAGSTDFGSLWSLTEQAGGFRWFIYAVFIIGIFLILIKLYELLDDRKRGATLMATDFRLLQLEQIAQAVAKEKNHMLARVLSTMLNVFQTRRSADTLHEEIANFLQFQRDQFATFNKRLDFLSDTAGALGLLGTVWGIFTVFGAGNLDKQAILSGMGLALITTVMGLVVSIILNLSTTEIFSVFNKRLDLIASKADQARFRLMEVYQGSEIGSNVVRLEDAGTSKGRVAPGPPAKVDLTGNNQSGSAGAALHHPLKVHVRDARGIPLAALAVRFRVVLGEGALNGQEREAVVRTNEDGVALSAFKLDKNPGFNSVEVAVDGMDRTFTFQAMGVE